MAHLTSLSLYYSYSEIFSSFSPNLVVRDRAAVGDATVDSYLFFGPYALFVCAHYIPLVDRLGAWLPTPSTMNLFPLNRVPSWAL